MVIEMRNRRGIALIMAVGILAILSALATSFMLTMRLEYKAAVNYYHSVQSRYIAEAGLAMGIEQLRLDARNQAFTYQHGVTSNINLGGEIIGSYTVSMADTQSKLNYYTKDTRFIEDLIRDVFPTKGGSERNDIRDVIVNMQVCLTLAEFKALKSDTELSDADFDTLSDYITASSFGISQYPISYDSYYLININSVDRTVLGALIGFISGMNANRIDDVFSAIDAARPITSWNQYDGIMTSLEASNDLTSAQATTMKSAFNPNRESSTSPVSLTDFCFTPGGSFAVTATGSSAGGGNRTINAEVGIFHVRYDTSQWHFEDGIQQGTTYHDAYKPMAGEWSSGCIKLGYYDDFDITQTDEEDYNEDITWTPSVSASSGISDFDNDGDMELVQAVKWETLLAPLDYAINYIDGNFYLKCTVDEIQAGFEMKDVAYILLRGTSPGDPALVHTRPGPYGLDLKPPQYAYLTASTPPDIQFLTDAQAQAQGLNPATDKYQFGVGQIREWHGQALTYDDRVDAAYSNGPREYEVSVHDAIVEGTITVPGNDPIPFNFAGVPSGSGLEIGLYGAASRYAFDDITIVTRRGDFGSKLFTPFWLGAVRWGTVTGTISNAAKGSIKMKGVAKDQDFDHTNYVDLESANPWQAIGHVTNSVYWRIHIMQDPAYYGTPDAPYLEDVTITYLPRVYFVNYELN